MIVEWNAHMFSRDTARYPFHPAAAYLPDTTALENDPLKSYLKRMDRLGIDRAVLVHPEPYGDDHRLILDCLGRESARLRGVCHFFPKDPLATEKLAAMVEYQPALVGVRLHAHRGKEHYLDSFADAGVRAIWRTAAERGLIVELHIGPNYAAQAAEAIAAYPSVPVLIDHLGEPQFGTPIEYADVLALARFPNLMMKISGVSYISTAASPHLDVKTFVRLVADTFGPDRLCWGGDTPGIVDAHLDHFSAAERAQVKGGNLARLLRLA
ncbi:MAG TPA: amidohydrolase family protein [Roseiflexaceae bacterium]|nr:amidohydrolase family protein [Roseiflexaceae bacterium]